MKQWVKMKSVHFLFESFLLSWYWLYRPKHLHKEYVIWIYCFSYMYKLLEIFKTKSYVILAMVLNIHVRHLGQNFRQQLKPII